MTEYLQTLYNTGQSYPIFQKLLHTNDGWYDLYENDILSCPYFSRIPEPPQKKFEFELDINEDVDDGECDGDNGNGFTKSPIFCGDLKCDFDGEGEDEGEWDDVEDVGEWDDGEEEHFLSESNDSEYIDDGETLEPELYNVMVKPCRMRHVEFKNIFPKQLCKQPYKYLLCLETNCYESEMLSFEILGKQKNHGSRFRKIKKIKVKSELKKIDVCGQRHMIHYKIFLKTNAKLFDRIYKLRVMYNESVPMFVSSEFDLFSRRKTDEKRFWRSDEKFLTSIN